MSERSFIIDRAGKARTGMKTQRGFGGAVIVLGLLTGCGGGSKDHTARGQTASAATSSSATTPSAINVLPGGISTPGIAPTSTSGMTSGLSPWLHFGHVSVHRLFRDVAAAEGWAPHRLGSGTSGAKEGWWGMSPAAEAFLDELVTWRELGFNMCSHAADYDRFEALPDWARRTMAEHADDPRPHRYDLATLEAARTHDPLWNAAQRELVAEGRMHNYMRMLWGKKVYEWSRSGAEALETLIHLNNKYAVDGRDPNSYAGICWVLGRYDRAWGPERPIFGKLRYMSSENTRRKLHLDRYLARHGAQPGLLAEGP
jgi:deoxyribodipyrimidine photo-lyase